MTNAIKQPPHPNKRASLKTLASIPLEIHTYKSVVFVFIFVLLHPLLCLTGNLIPIHPSLACMHLVETTRRHMREWLKRYKSPLRDAQWWPWLLPRYTVAEGERTPEFSRIHAIALVSQYEKANVLWAVRMVKWGYHWHIQRFNWENISMKTICKAVGSPERNNEQWWSNRRMGATTTPKPERKKEEIHFLEPTTDREISRTVANRARAGGDKCPDLSLSVSPSLNLSMAPISQTSQTATGKSSSDRVHWGHVPEHRARHPKAEGEVGEWRWKQITTPPPRLLGSPFLSSFCIPSSTST